MAPGGWGGSWVEGLDETLVEALTPIASEETEWSLDDMVLKFKQKIRKSSTKFSRDERANQKSTSTQAKVLIEEYVAAVMGALNTMCYERAWFSKVNFTAPLVSATVWTFSGTKVLGRILGPFLEKAVEDAIFVHQEEERISKAIWDAIESSGVKESHRKKANNHLTKAYDEAHTKAPWNQNPADTPEMGMLQDFVVGWMSEFVQRGWDVIENGTNAGSRDEMVLLVTVLFQNLLDPSIMAVPHEIASGIQAAPAAPWSFIGEAAEAVFKHVEQESSGGGGKRRKTGAQQFS